MSWFRACGVAASLVACSAAAPLAPPPVIYLPPPADTARPARASTPAPAPSALPQALPAVVARGAIGASGPLSLLAASASAAWVALCQGEPSAGSLVIGSGLGEPIDEVLAYDPSGRYVIVAQSGDAILIDTERGTRFDLSAAGADTRRARQDYAAHRTLSFDASGRHLAYLRVRGATSELVVRELDSGSERAFASGAGSVFRLRLSPDARHVTFEAVREDTNGNGTLDWPVPPELERQSACVAGPPRLRSYAHLGRGDSVTRAVATLSDGAVRDVPELVTLLGTQLLLRERDGSLELERAGSRRVFAPVGCAGRVLFADAEREQALVTCVIPKKAGKRQVWWFGEGAAKNLQVELYETATDRDATSGARLVPVYPGSEAALFDLTERELLALPTGSRVLSTTGSRALVWRGGELLAFDAVTKQEERLAQGIAKNPFLLQAGDALLLSPFVVVGAAAPVLHSPTAHPLAVSSAGLVLAGEPSVAADPRPRGPLRWLDATAAPQP